VCQDFGPWELDDTRLEMKSTLGTENKKEVNLLWEKNLDSKHKKGKNIFGGTWGELGEPS